MSYATTSSQGPSTADCEVLTDIHTEANLDEVEIISLVQETIPRYRLRAETDFACSNEDFIQTPRIDGSEFKALNNTEIRELFSYFALGSERISQMTKTFYDVSAVTRMLEEREKDLRTAVVIGQNLLESNGTLRNQVTLLEKDIEQTSELVKQLKHDLLLKERLIRFYSDLEESNETLNNFNLIDVEHFQQKLRNLEDENHELRSEAMQLKIEAENFEQHEQMIVDNYVNELADANAQVDQLRLDLQKKNDENIKQNEEFVRLTSEMREIRRRLIELKKENEELKQLLNLTGKNRDEYETKIRQLEENYSECLLKLHQSQQEVNALQEKLVHLSPSTSINDLSSSSHRQTVFLSPVDYANFMGIENSLKSELEEVLEDPRQFFLSTNEPIRTAKKIFRRRTKKFDPNDTDGESTINDSAFSDTESLSSSSSCPNCNHRCSSDTKMSSSSTFELPKRTTSGFGLSTNLRLVKRFEGSNLLKRWQQLAEPSLSSCLQKTPGVYTRAEILHDVHEEEEEEEETSATFLPICPDPDDIDRDPTTPPSSPLHGAQIQTNALLQQVLQRLVGILITEKTNVEETINSQKTTTITPPSSPTFNGLAAPTPNTAMRAMKSSTFLRISSLTTGCVKRSPGEIPNVVNDFLRGCYPSRT